MMFSHKEQEEIINTFLANINDKEEIINTFLNKNNSELNEEVCENEDLKAVYDRLNIEAGDQTRQILRIETKHYIPIKHAMLKFYDKSDVKDIDMYDYRRNKMIKNYKHELDIIKQRGRYVCSKERLEKIDFIKIERALNYWEYIHN